MVPDDGHHPVDRTICEDKANIKAKPGATLDLPVRGVERMPHRAVLALAWIVAVGVLTTAALRAGGAAVSRDQAEAFARKVALIVQHGTTPSEVAARRRTTLTETEMNSWFVFRGTRVLPAGVSSPSLSLIGNGRLTGVATVDLEALGRRRGGGAFDVFSYLGGQVPVAVTGVLRSRDGRAQFELQEATAAGVPVPAFLLQEAVSLYTRTADDPDGMSLERPFDLPVNIRQIELGQGQATVVQ